jgi:hypothetical protein
MVSGALHALPVFRYILRREVFMRSRLAVLTLSLYLCIALACTSRPPANDASNATPAENQPASTENTDGGMAPSSGGQMAQTPAPAPEPPKPLVVPAGTTLTVRLAETLSSKTSTDGQPFSGTLVNPVSVEGETVFPAGSRVSGAVVVAHSAGRFKGASLLEIKLDSITSNGRQVAISTSPLSKGEKGKGKRSAAMIGGGAGAGALIGGLAGGGKGAAIGALVGGGAGTAGAGLTGNRDVEFPAESAASFKLAAPVQIQR